MITIKQLFKIYNLKTWKKNKFQMFLSIFSISIAVTILLSIQLMISLNDSYINRNAKNVNEGDINITLSNQRLSADQLSVLRDLKTKGYFDYTTTYRMQNKLVYGDVSSVVFLKFVDPKNYPVVGKKEDDETKLVDNEVFINKTLANRFNLKKDDVISVDIKGFSKAFKFKISNIINTSTTDENIIGAIIINKSILLGSEVDNTSDMYDNKDDEALASNIHILLSDKYKLVDIKNKLNETFSNSGKISTYQDILDSNKQLLDKESKALSLIEIFVILISGAGILVTITLLNIKRKKDYVILNIYGMSEGLLKKEILYETYIISILGNIIGVILSLIIVGFTERAIMVGMDFISIISGAWLQIISTVIFIVVETLIFAYLSTEIGNKINPATILRQQKQSLKFSEDLFSPVFKAIILLTVSFSLYIRSFTLGGMYICLLLIFISSILALVYVLINQIVRIRKNKSKRKYLLLAIRNLERQKMKFSIGAASLVTVVALCGFIVNISYEIIPSIMSQYVSNNGYNVVIEMPFNKESELETLLKEDRGIDDYIKVAATTSKLSSVNNTSLEDILKKKHYNDNVTKNYINTLSNISVKAIDLSNNMINYPVVKGRWFTSEDKNSSYVVLGNKFSELGININDEIDIKIKEKSLKLKVIGIMGRNIVNGDDGLYMNLSDLEEGGLLNNNYSKLQYLIKSNPNNEKEIAFKLNMKLKEAQVINMADELKQVEEYIQKLTVIFVLICAISIFSAVCLIANILMIINFERIKEFLTLKVVGAKNRDIRKITTIEGIIIGGISGILASLISEIVSSVIMNKIFYLKYYPNIVIISSMISITIVLSIISSLAVIRDIKIENCNEMFRAD